MAKKPKNIVSVLQKLGGLKSPDDPIPKKDILNDAGTTISKAERNKLIERLTVQGAPSDLTKDAVLRYIAEMSKRLSNVRKDNIEILKLAPEINQAASIVIPSIMSPTDLRDSNVQFTCNDPKLDADENNRVAAVITKYFNETLRLSTKIPEWIKESLYISGAKPLLTIPLSELDDLINSKDFLEQSTENMQTLFECKANDSLFGFGTTDVKNSIEDYIKSVETFCDSLAQDPDAKVEPTAKPYNRRNKEFNTTVTDFINDILSVEKLSLTDNPDILKSKNLQKNTSRKMSEQLGKKYKISDFVSLSDQNENIKGHPLFLELPTESVIPIYVPGTPSDHIGYFVFIDQFGNPISFIEDMDDGPRSLNSEQRSTFDNLFKAFGFADLRTYGNMQSQIMSDVYQQIIDKHLKSKLKDIGLQNVNVGMDNSVFKNMFARYLANRHTKILFVPKDLMTYFCFQYNENGTGRGKLEDVKFILSLRITILVCRMLTAMNNAVDRRRLEVTLNDNIGNPFEFIETLKQEAITKSLVSFSRDPDEITRSLAQRSLTVRAKNLPGAPDFEVTNEPNERTASQFDESLNEDVRNLMILGLDGPPASAFNQLSENEYSKSVATTNLFFSRKISHLQTGTCEKATHFVRQYTRMSQHLREAIIKAIEETTEGKKEAGTAEKHDVNDIINHIHMVLPPPNIAPDLSQFDELDHFTQAITGLLKAVFDDDLFANDNDSKETLAALRASIQSEIILDHIRRLGMTGIKFPDIESMLPDEMLKFQQVILNFKASLQQAKAFLAAQPAPEDPSSTSTF